MAPGGTLFRFTPHFGENVLPHGSHEWLPYSKNKVRLKCSNTNLSMLCYTQIVILQVYHISRKEERGAGKLTAVNPFSLRGLTFPPGHAMIKCIFQEDSPCSFFPIFW